MYGFMVAGPLAIPPRTPSNSLRCAAFSDPEKYLTVVVRERPFGLISRAHKGMMALYLVSVHKRQIIGITWQIAIADERKPDGVGYALVSSH